MIDETKPSFYVLGTVSAHITIPSYDATPTLSLASQPLPHINNITDVLTPGSVTPPPTPGSQTNFSVGWWLYVNTQPTGTLSPPVPTNFGPGWFMYQNGS